MKQMTWNKSRGMTLTELLAVLLIISLLTTIAVPVYVGRQEDARIRVAMAECREIAQAEDLVFASHGFYVPFQLLDELPVNPNRGPVSNEERIDSHQVATGGADSTNIFLVDPTILADDQIGSQFTLADGEGATPRSPKVRNLIQNWSGPFMSFQRFWYDTTSAIYDGPTDPDYRNSNDMFLDFPMDPWGNPYRFYSSIGVIGDGRDEESDFNFINPDPGFSNGELSRRDDHRFQRYAVISFGRDGIADTDPEGGLLPVNAIPNDVFYEFGTDGLSRNFGRF